MIDLVKGSNKFKRLNEDLTTKREGQLQRFLRKLKKNNKISDNVYEKIYPVGSKPARLYRCPIHKCQSEKEVPPFRPIVSSISCFNYITC